jgi:hypothetical protein
VPRDPEIHWLKCRESGAGDARKGEGEGEGDCMMSVKDSKRANVRGGSKQGAWLEGNF